MDTFMANPDAIERKWYVIDAAGLPLDVWLQKLPTFKEKETHFTPYVDTGDYVIVINAAKVKVTGRSLTRKNISIILIT